MSGVLTVPTESIALAESATKTLILLNPVAAVKIRQFDISFAAAVTSESIQIDLYHVTTIGSPVGTSKTPVVADEHADAATSTALVNLTTEPTTIEQIASYYVQPLGGLVSIPFAFAAEVEAKLGGKRIGLRIITPSTVKPKCLSTLWFEE